MKKFAPLALIFILSGCSYLNSKLTTDPVSQNEKTCRDLKRNIIFNTASSPNLGPASAAQKAEMLKLYDTNHCDRLEKDRRKI